MSRALASAVVFDLDGTLVDTLEDIAAAVNHTLSALGCPTHPVDAYRTMVGDGARVLVERALPPGGGDLLKEALARFRARYSGHLVERSRLYPGIAELLDDLAARRIPAAIVSNKPEEHTGEVARRLLGRWPFAAIAGQREGVPRKPDPTASLEASRAMGVGPGSCLFVGDSAVDMRTGRAACMIPVGVSWGFRGREELVAAGATVIVNRPEDVGALLGPPPAAKTPPSA